MPTLCCIVGCGYPTRPLTKIIFASMLNASMANLTLILPPNSRCIWLIRLGCLFRLMRGLICFTGGGATQVAKWLTTSMQNGSGRSYKPRATIYAHRCSLMADFIMVGTLVLIAKYAYTTPCDMYQLSTLL